MHDPNVDFTGAGWKIWSPDDRPPETLNYVPLRWLAKDVNILGRVMDVEWTEKQHPCGMGVCPQEWWPPGSDWNGYRRKLRAPYLWRELAPAEPTNENYVFHGLNLLPCPFTGRPPVVFPSKTWVGAPPFVCDMLTVQSWIASVSRRSIDELEDTWNRRP